MGRLVCNDLSLNHPSVSRTHAGIKEVGSRLLDLQPFELERDDPQRRDVDSSPLAAGDVIKMGPFTIYISFTNRAHALGRAERNPQRPRMRARRRPDRRP